MRVKGGTTTRARRKKILKMAKGYFGSKHLLFKTAHEQVMHSLHYAYVSRRTIKRDYRKLWILLIEKGIKNKSDLIPLAEAPVSIKIPPSLVPIYVLFPVEPL